MMRVIRTLLLILVISSVTCGADKPKTSGTATVPTAASKIAIPLGCHQHGVLVFQGPGSIKDPTWTYVIQIPDGRTLKLVDLPKDGHIGSEHLLSDLGHLRAPGSDFITPGSIPSDFEFCAAELNGSVSITLGERKTGFESYLVTGISALQPPKK
jgi:hypothetical protein